MRARRCRGQALIESALVLAAFLGLVLGIVDIGQILFTKQTLVQRVDQAARWGAMNQYDPQAIRSLVLYGTPSPARNDRPFPGLEKQSIEITNPGCPGTECRVRVAIPGQGVRSVQPAE